MPAWRSVSELSKVTPTLVVSTDEVRSAVVMPADVPALAGSFIRSRIWGH